jgi:hypothetical protein
MFVSRLHYTKKIIPLVSSIHHPLPLYLYPIVFEMEIGMFAKKKRDVKLMVVHGMQMFSMKKLL